MLPPSGRTSRFLGSWSARHIVAHLVGWDHTNTQAVSQVRNRKIPSFFQHYDHDWASYNAALVKRFNRGSYQNLIAGASNSSRRLLAYLETIPASEFFTDTGLRTRGWTVTIGRLLAVEAKDERAHAAQIRRFRKVRAKRGAKP